MYAKRVQIINYGPIGELDIEFPFDGDVPKPVVLVGANGSGKSILLSHIVNGLTSAKDHAYPESPEIETGKVFKLRSSSYIKSGGECYFAKADFEDGLSIGELRSRLLKRDYQSMPSELTGEAATSYWDQMASDMTDHLDSTIFNENQNKVREIFSRNCALYFPPNRFEEPAWLNEDNLLAQAEYMDFKRVQGYTNRKVINYSPLRDNQNWLFEVVYDRAVFEVQTTNVPLQLGNSGQSVEVPAIVGHSGNATSAFDIALQVIRRMFTGHENVMFGIGRRQNRAVSLYRGTEIIVPNIFQLSSGETALLDLFLSILRDFDLSGATFSNAVEIRGIAVVDEIDLHLHAVHQHEILPSLMRMFPKVQFVVSTHSPLFVLGMTQTFGEDGFTLIRLPQGQQISPEEFTEFGDAYQAFTATSKFSDDIRTAVRDAQSPILYMEGKTDVQYLVRAANLLGQNPTLNAIEVDEREGGGNLKKIWEAVKNLPVSIVSRKVVLLHDCDYEGPDQTEETVFRRTIPHQREHPIERGIENLFSKATLEKALGYKPEFIDISEAHQEKVRGNAQSIPEKWVVNEDEKTNLSNWLCENGTTEDFQHFQSIFDLLEEALGNPKNELCNSA